MILKYIKAAECIAMRELIAIPFPKTRTRIKPPYFYWSYYHMSKQILIGFQTLEERDLNRVAIISTKDCKTKQDVTNRDTTELISKKD